MERNVIARLDELGITESMIMDHRDKGGRSAVIGSYRILMYRASCDEETATSNSEKAIEEKEQKEHLLAPPTSPSNGSFTSSTKSNRSTTSKKSESSLTKQRVPTPQPSVKQGQSTPPQASPNKPKLKEKLTLTLLPGKKGEPLILKDKKSNKKKKVSQACTIL